jgi:trehalose 6-phosphate synthase
MNSKSKKSKPDPASFVVVANRLPVERVEQPDGTADWRPSPGGLVTAFEPIMRRRHGAWVGWHGAADEELEPFEHEGLTLEPVPLSSSEVEDYYEGFSNGTLWPLYHDAIAPPQFRREWWNTYIIVNQRFADHVAEVAAEGAVVWVQDYHLQLLPQMLRRQRPDVRSVSSTSFPPTEHVPGGDGSWAPRARISSVFSSQAPEFCRLVTTLGHKSARIGSDARRARVWLRRPNLHRRQRLHRLPPQPEATARRDPPRSWRPRVMFLGVDALDCKGLLGELKRFSEAILEGKIDPTTLITAAACRPSRDRSTCQLRDDIGRMVGGSMRDRRIGRAHHLFACPIRQMAAICRRGERHGGAVRRHNWLPKYVACRQQDDVARTSASSAVPRMTTPGVSGQPSTSMTSGSPGRP